MPRFWTCQRRSDGVKCGYRNPAIKRKCESCGKPRPPRKRPEHLRALDVPYATYVELFGERCGICGKAPGNGRRLDRDHDHDRGVPRGLLCHRCNRDLPRRKRLSWMRPAVSYLERHEERLAEVGDRCYIRREPDEGGSKR